MGKNKKYPPTDLTHSPNKRKEYIGHFDQAPEILKDNQHILKGYRLNYDNPKSIIKSLFHVHNQTVNIWTHLIGAIIIFFFIFEGIAYEMEESHVLGRAIIKDFITPYAANSNTFQPNIDPKQLCALLNEGLKQGESQYQYRSGQGGSQLATWPIMIALLGGAICLACSSTFHLIHPMNEKIFNISLGLDFAGIGINMAFSPVPAFYYSLYCDHTTSSIYITLVVVAGILSFITAVVDWFKRKQNTIYKIAILIISSIICVTGLIHLMINQFLYGNFGDRYSIVPSLFFNFAALLSYGLGFIFYLRKCPERYHPGRYDICGSSHQIWHVFVFLAIVFTYLGALTCYEVRSQMAICPSWAINGFEL